MLYRVTVTGDHLVLPMQMWPLKLSNSTSYEEVNCNMLELIKKINRNENTNLKNPYNEFMDLENISNNPQGSWTPVPVAKTLVNIWHTAAILPFLQLPFPIIKLHDKFTTKEWKIGTKDPAYHSLISWLQLFISLPYSQSNSRPSEKLQSLIQSW